MEPQNTPDWGNMQEVTDPSVLSQLNTPQTNINKQANRNPMGLTGQQYLTAKQKAASFQVLDHQLQRIEDEFNKSQRNTGLAALKEYNPFSQDNSVFDQAVNNARTSITAITRVPGIGSMSDYESRLQEAVLPNRWKFDGGNIESIRNMRMLVKTLGQGYAGMLGAAPALPSAPPAGRTSNRQSMRAKYGLK